MASHAHRAEPPHTIRLGIVTVSTSRRRKDDRSGQWIEQEAQSLGFNVADYQVVTDNQNAILSAVSGSIQTSRVDAVIVTGGTGLTPQDVTVEALRPLFEKELTAFGSLFTTLSYQEIGPASMLSRATAGIIGETAVFCLPGSPKACRLACEALIFPELGHLVGHIRQPR